MSHGAAACALGEHAVNIDPLELAIRIPIILLALTLHEFAHAYTAFRLGDPTAHRLGRCTLNPLAHLEPIGTLCLLFAPIGWAKPVPVNVANLDNPRRDDILISIAGPASNVLQAFVYAIVLRFVFNNGSSIVTSLGPDAYTTFVSFMFAGITINVGLAVFNMIPAFPLDGYHVVANLSKASSYQQLQEMAKIGPFIIIGIILLNRTELRPLSRVMEPFMRFFVGVVAGGGY